MLKQTSRWDLVVYLKSKIPELILFFCPLAFRMLVVGVKALRQSVKTHVEVVRLDQMRYYHSVDFRPALKKLNQRVAILRKNETFLLSELPLLREKYEGLIPSIDPIQLVPIVRNRSGVPIEYLIVQGQGRIKALKEVFSWDTPVEIQIVTIPTKTLQQMLKIRSYYLERGRLMDPES